MKAILSIIFFISILVHSHEKPYGTYELGGEKLVLNENHTFFYSKHLGSRGKSCEGSWKKISETEILLKSDIINFDIIPLEVKESFDPKIKGIKVRARNPNGNLLWHPFITLNQKKKVWFYRTSFDNPIPDSEYEILDFLIDSLNNFYITHQFTSSELYEIKNPKSNVFDITYKCSLIYTDNYYILNNVKAVLHQDSLNFNNQTLYKRKK